MANFFLKQDSENNWVAYIVTVLDGLSIFSYNRNKLPKEELIKYIEKNSIGAKIFDNLLDLNDQLSVDKSLFFKVFYFKVTNQEDEKYYSSLIGSNMAKINRRLK